MAGENYITSFKGELDGKTIIDFTSQLDYDIEDINERIELVNDILYPDGNLDEYFVQYFNQETKDICQTQPYFKVNLSQGESLSEDNSVCKKLDQMANYILFCEGQREINKIEDPYKSKSSINHKKSRETSFEELECVIDRNGNSVIEKEIANKNNIKKSKKQKIFKSDLKNPYLKQMQVEIDKLLLKIKDEKTDDKTKSKCIKAVSELKYDQKLAKESLFKTIDFKALLPDTTIFDFDSDSGYYDEQDNYTYVSENRINLSDSLHVYFLINFYSELRMENYDNCHSDMKYILDSLDYLIDNCDLKDFEKDIIIMRIDKLGLTNISDQLKVKYGLDYPTDYISKIIRNRICKKVALHNSNCFEDWFYFQRAVGKYKKCSKCGEVKLAHTDKYFSYNKLGKDGFRPECKECFNKNRKNS